MFCHYRDIEEFPGSPEDRTLTALTARGLGSIPAQGSKIPKVKGHGQIKQNKKETLKSWTGALPTCYSTSST